MARRTCFLCLLVTSFAELSTGARFILTVPKKPHYDAELTASVTAYGILPGQSETVTLEYKGHTDASQSLNFTELQFKSDGVQTWKVVFPWERMHALNEQAVKLILASPSVSDSVTLWFAEATGYIFIQTDKPIYTPRQTVKFRVIAVNEYQQLAKYQIKVDIKNDKQIIVDRIRYSAEDAFKAQEFELPKDTSPGIWSISANFEGLDHTAGTSHTVKFEVREYVLPRFSTTLQIDTSVITKDIEWITATVKATYVYGRPVFGTTELQLGVWDDVNGIQLFPQRYGGKLVDGQLKVDIRVGTLFPDDSFPVNKLNKRLYVSVNVTEEATLENDTIVDTSTFIMHPYYTVNFQKSKNHFKPGFPYTLEAQVAAQSGTPAKLVLLYIMAVYTDKNNSQVGGEAQLLQLNAYGEMSKTFQIPAAAHKLNFQIQIRRGNQTVVMDLQKTRYQRYDHLVEKLNSSNNQYIHISLKSPVQEYRDGEVLLRYTPADLLATGQQITILILAKGHVKYTTSVVRNSDGRSKVKIPSYLYNEASPFIRIVAYYHVSYPYPEDVIDSLYVETSDVCLDEVFLMPPGGIHGTHALYKPKDHYILDIEGSDSMIVGLVAVDKAVLLLNNKQTLTRELMFKQLASHDQGVRSGDGRDFNDILMNSGLLSLVIDTSITQTDSSSLRVLTGFADIIDQPVVRKSIDNAERVAQATPPQTMRSYFPESWLFEERKLPKSGSLSLNLTLPDSITTWSFMVVGLSSNRGVCVSHHLEQVVHKLFFADVRIPYKVTRLEEVKVKIAVYNYQVYPLDMRVIVSGSEGLCFSANSARGTTQNSTTFNLRIEAGKVAAETVKVIPLQNGDLTLRVDLQNQHERDVIERNLHVVAEGHRVKKTITFVLDPEAKHVTYRAVKKKTISLMNTTTIKNIFDIQNKEQRTKIDLALPKEVIRGTEFCRIAAFGDLMGDIITHAVVQSKSLTEQRMLNAEEVLGDLSPTVYALLYANKTGLMDEELSNRGRNFVKHGVTRLLKYKQGLYFTLDVNSKPATWLTAFALKTLCRASTLAFIDKKSLIDEGFDWLLSQTEENGSMHELDWRLAKESFEYKVMLSAEVLITVKECDRSMQDSNKFSPIFTISSQPFYGTPAVVMTSSIEAYTLLVHLHSDNPSKSGINVDGIADWLVSERNHNGVFIGAMENHLTLQDRLVKYLEENLNEIKEPMVLAKVAYALLLANPNRETTQRAVKKLTAMKKKNQRDHYYWSDEIETNENSRIPHWYHDGAKASSIEATAYALLVHLHPDNPSKSGVNVDAIADWLVSERNHNGAFIGAMDSSAAINALSLYSVQKHGLEIDLHCNVTSDRLKEIIHSFSFTEKNATRPESLSNVPVGQVLQVNTRGQGLGQMQVKVEYNIPIDRNQHCPFKIDVNVKRTVLRWSLDMHSNPLCTHCDIGCTESVNATQTSSKDEAASPTPAALLDKTKSRKKLGPVQVENAIKERRRKRKTQRERNSDNNKEKSKPPAKTKPKVQKPKTKLLKNRKTKQEKLKSKNLKRQRRQTSAVSKMSICIQICLQPTEKRAYGPIDVDVEMLTGYRPVPSDVERIKNQSNVKVAEYLPQSEILYIQLSEVSGTEKTCFALRAVDEEDIGRRTPATVKVTEIGRPVPSCVMEYDPVLGEESLRVYCADFSHSNRGECRCYSGQCSTCGPGNSLDLYTVKQLVCKAPVAYQIQFDNVENLDNWVEIDARVLSLNKTGSHRITPGDTIKLMAPTSCVCPAHTFTNKSETVYMLSADVEKMNDRNGNNVYRYLLDEQSIFLRVSDHPSYEKPALQFIYLQEAFMNNRCLT